MQIGRQDLLWNYAATFLKIGVGIILLPFIVRSFPQETVAIWAIYASVMSLTYLLDFGFAPSFTRNVSYIISGVKELKRDGHQIVEANNSEIDYRLFKGLIGAMRWFYSRLALVLFLLLTILGTYYMYVVLKNYESSHTEVYISWFIICILNTYSLYTYYYDALLQGMGLIKRAKQILVIGETIYLLVAVFLILMQFNLIAIVSAQALSLITRRILSYRTIYTPDFKKKLSQVFVKTHKEFIKPILPNAIKLGINGLGAFLVRRSPIVMAPLFLPLDIVASYGISIQIIWIITEVANVYPSTYQPKIAQYRIQNNIAEIKKCYSHACLLMLLMFSLFGSALLLLGDWCLRLIDSKTSLLSSAVIAAILLIYLLERNQFIAIEVLATKNRIPFFKASLFSGITTTVLLFVFFKTTSFGTWGLILAPGIAQSIYSNWKWPLEMWKDLRMQANMIIK
jgi:O-antigen/teichoic acid export membrane protein